MIRRKRYNLSEDERAINWLKKQQLMKEKEQVFLSEPWIGYCDNTDHPLFTIKVTKEKPYAACYYCSKLWMLTDDKED